MRYPASLAALGLLSALSAASPNGFSRVKSADDGPNKLDECGCWPIYQAMLKCQKLAGPNSGVRDCVCIPNPDGWYTSLNGCRACLSPGSYDTGDFFDNLSLTITQLFVSCTEVGGGITSDGVSICASNAYREACAALKTGGQPSWASYEDFRDSSRNGNGTYVLDIAEYGQNASSSAATSATRTTMDSTATTTATANSASTITTTTTDSASTAGASATTGAAGSPATSAPSTTTTAPSSARGFAGSRSQAGPIMGIAIALGVGGPFFY